MHILKDFITIDDLKTRWGCDKELIESFTYETNVTPSLTMWYATEIRTRPDGGQSAIVKRAQYLNGCVFDMRDVLAVEADNPELLQTGPRDDGYIEIREPMISGDKVLERWPGIYAYEFADIIEQHAENNSRVLVPYRIHKILCFGSEIIAECSRYEIRRDLDTGEVCSPPYLEYDIDRPPTYNFSVVAFKLAEIAEYEKTRPKLFYKLVKNPAEAWETRQPLAKDGEIQVDEIRKALMMSPQDFIDFLNCRTTDNRLVTSWEEDFRKANDYVPYFTREDLQNEHLTVHALDLEKFQRRERELEERFADVPFEGNPTPLADLKSQLAEKESQIAELKAQSVLAATVVKEEAPSRVNAAKWEGSVSASFGVWAEIVTGDKADWIEDEFRAAIAERYSDYHSKVLSIAWGSLPIDFKNGTGRRKKNSNKSQQSENIHCFYF